MSVMAHWFKRRRSTTLGIITFAASIGGIVFPVVFRNLLITIGCAEIVISDSRHPDNINYSFKWTMRVMASILALAMGITNLV